MSFFSAVVAIVAIAAFAWLRSQRYRAMGPASDNPEWASSQREIELERQVDTLKQRIEVLERIALEERKGDRLAREIEKLRD